MEYAVVQPNSTRVCDIGSDFIGRTVVIEATRISDHAHYDYFVDKMCKEPGNMIEIGDNADGADESVEHFERDWVTQCRTQGSSPLCSLRANMVVEARIVGATDSGHLGVGAIGRPMARISKVSFVRFERSR